MTEFEPPVIATFDNGQTQKMQGARHIRERNRGMLAIPKSKRRLTLSCTRPATPGRRSRSAVFAVVARDGDDETLFLSGLTIARQQYDVAISMMGEPYIWSHALGHLCPCGERHAISIARVWELVDAVRYRDQKGREVPWQRVALD